MTSPVEIGTLLDRDPAIRAGRPKTAGTGVTVMRVAGWYKMGLTAEEIATQYGHLSLAQVHAAVAYYHANLEKIEVDLADEEELLKASLNVSLNLRKAKPVTSFAALCMKEQKRASCRVDAAISRIG